VVSRSTEIGETCVPSALRTSVVVWKLSIDQPTTSRENASRTAQQ
jgi:hypothetical protein